MSLPNFLERQKHKNNIPVTKTAITMYVRSIFQTRSLPGTTLEDIGDVGVCFALLESIPGVEVAASVLGAS